MAEMQSNRNDDIFGRTDKQFGIPSIDSLALKYSKAQLQQMAQMGRIPPIYAVMAGMAQDRIQLNNSQASKTTVAQDTLGQQVADSSGQGITDSSGAAVGAGEPVAPQSVADISRAHGGLMSIPRPGEKYDQSNFATGGIVAFDAGGEVPEEQYRNPYYSEIAAQRASIPDTQAQALQAYYAGAPERAKARSKQDLNMNLIRLGANIGAQSGPFGTQNIFKGLAATAPNFAESLAGQRADTEAGIKGMADVEQRRRTEAIEGQKSAEGIFKELRQAGIHAGKDTDARAEVAAYVANQMELVKEGKRKDNPSMSKLQTEAFSIIGERRLVPSYLQHKIGAGGLENKQEETVISRQATNAKINDTAIDNIAKSFERRGMPRTIELNRLKKLDKENRKAGKPTTLAADYVSSLEKQEFLRLGGIDTPPLKDNNPVPVVNPKPLAARLPNDIQKLVDKTYPTK
jgi:hypothetical protein